MFQTRHNKYVYNQRNISVLPIWTNSTNSLGRNIYIEVLWGSRLQTRDVNTELGDISIMDGL